jgi:hypothetical protein
MVVEKKLKLTDAPTNSNIFNGFSIESIQRSPQVEPRGAVLAIHQGRIFPLLCCHIQISELHERKPFFTSANPFSKAKEAQEQLSKDLSSQRGDVF